MSIEDIYCDIEDKDKIIETIKDNLYNGEYFADWFCLKTVCTNKLVTHLKSYTYLSGLSYWSFEEFLEREKDGLIIHEINAAKEDLLEQIDSVYREITDYYKLVNKKG